MGTLKTWRKTYGALKDSTKVGLTHVNTDYVELYVAIVKATNHVECSPKERHLLKIAVATSAVRPWADVAYCIHALARRLAKTNNWTPTEELQNSFKFKTYLIMTKIYNKIYLVDGILQQKSFSRKRKHSANDEMDIVFTKPEDQVYYELCSWFVNFPLHTAPVTPPELKNYRLMGLVMAIETEKIPTFQQKLKSLINKS